MRLSPCIGSETGEVEAQDLGAEHPAAHQEGRDQRSDHRGDEERRNGQQRITAMGSSIRPMAPGLEHQAARQLSPPS